MRKSTAALGIDIQNDFTRPNGKLYVPGSENDIWRIYAFIEECGRYIDHIALSMDSHQPIHIASQIYWKDKEGYPPAEFTTITAESVEKGKWYPQFNQPLALDYLKDLEATGQSCTIWPIHCIQGSWGWALNESFYKALHAWSVLYNRQYELFFKGNHQATEHYSIFKAAVEIPDAPETKLNTQLLDILNSYERILVMGEAADFCVVNSLHDMIVARPEMIDRIIVLTDCMSWIDPNNHRAMALYDEAQNLGVRFMTSVEFKKNEL